MMKIYKAKIEEAKEIKKLLYKTWGSTYADLYSHQAIDDITSEWHAIELLRKQIVDPDRLFLVAKNDNKIVGTCNTDVVKNDKINIQRLHVDPDHQRQGIGTALINKVVETFPKAKKIDLEVEKRNLKAISFYKKRGYKVVSKKIFEVKNVKMPCYIMEKDL